MQQSPAGWPDEGEVEIIPDTFLRLPGSSWPPARDGVPAGSSSCAEWSIDRTLTGGFLPGQVRAASGFSIATANVSIPQSQGTQMTPWAPTGWQLTPGGSAQIFASHGGADSANSLLLGKFKVEPISGSPSDNQVNLDLVEDSGRLKRPVAIKWAYTSTDADRYSMDASWVLDQIARAGGYYTTAKPDSQTVLSMPLVGGPACDRGTTFAATIDNFREDSHVIGLSGVSSVSAQQSGSGIGSVFFLSAQVAGTGGIIRMGDVLIEVTPAEVNVIEGSSTRAVISLGRIGLSHVQMRLTKITNGFIIRARADNGDWSSDRTATFAGSIPWEDDEVTVSTISPTGFIRAVRLDNAEYLSIWAQPTAIIELSGSPIRGIFDNEKKPGWDLAQNIATSTLGGLWISETGVFTYRSRHTLRGIETPVETVESLDQIERLTWRVDPADIADRIEVTYTPSDVIRSNDSITLWEATNVIVVRQFSTQNIYFDIEGTTDRISPFVPIWDESTTDTRFSRYAASTSREAGGAQPANDALRFTSKMVGPSRVRITVQNTTSSPLWLVDGNGNPLLTVRTSLQVAPGEPVTVEQGVDEDDSISPLSIDCGSVVQDHATAVELCAWLEGQTRVALPTIEQVRVKPDLKRQIGDIIRLTDGITNLSTKAIITSVQLQGNHEGYTQTLNLSMLTTTFVDMDDWLTDYARFADWDAWMSSQGITTFAQLDSWIDTLGRGQ